MKISRALALAAIVVPAATLAVLGAVSLGEWQRSAELLFRAQARDMASMAAAKIEMMLREAEDAALARLQAVVARSGTAPDALDRFMATTPLAGRLFLFDRAGARRYPIDLAPADALRADRLVAEAPDELWERGGRRETTVGEAPVLLAVVKSREGAPLLAALVVDREVLRRDIFGATLGGLEASTILAVEDDRGRPVYSRQPLAGPPLLSVPFREALPAWRVALYEPPVSSPRAAIRRQGALFTAAFGLTLVVIVAGIVLTWRLVRRETEMARLKSDFVANVSHDLKTPLSVIRMFGETLEMGRVADEPTRREYYRVITRESERLSRLIDNVLDFSRIEGGRRRYDIVPTAVEPLVRETVEAFAYPVARQGGKVVVDIDPALPDVPLDAEAVAQALANLVDNAIKYSGERLSLRVEARVVDGELALAVEDEGIGIPREEHARIFEKFYRVGRSDTQGRRGSGVGLALVRHVAEAHGGRATVESEPGRGSRFTLRLPVR